MRRTPTSGQSRTGAPRSVPPLAPAPRQRSLPSSSDTVRTRGPRSAARRVGQLLGAVAAVLVLGLAGTWMWVERNMQRVDALSGAADTPGTTYLIVGSDSRDGWGDDGTEGARTDTILVLHRPVNGPVALISIPRDSYAEIPGHGGNKINAAFAFGGAPLLVQTVEQLSGLTVDHYIEVGFGGVESIVDAVGGVELCYDRDVSDDYSGMYWTAGCHEVDGPTALAFSRMRYEDPLGDIGRTQRQRQVVGAVADKATSRDILLNPFKAFPVAKAGLDAVAVSEGTNGFDMLMAVRAFRAATGPEGVTGTPPIASLDYRPGKIGSAVLLDPDRSPAFWRAIADGDVEPGSVVGGIG